MVQVIALILFSITIAITSPIVILAFSAYTLYSSITLAKISNRRQADMLAAAVVGRGLSRKTLKR